MTLKINIARSRDQSGGSIIEVYTENTRIILDAAGTSAYDAVFVSHFHNDLIGVLKETPTEIPIYMGRDAYNVACALAEYKGKSLGFSPVFMEAGAPVAIGDISLTPILCGHSAYGTFMFLIRACGKSILYAADFRVTGRMDFSALLEELPEVDALILGCAVHSQESDSHALREQDLEDFAVKTLADRKGPAIVYLSAQNVDRIATAYNAAQRSGRRFIMDELMALVAEAAGLQIEGSVLRVSHSLADLGEIVATSAGGIGSSDHIGLTGRRRIAKAFPAVTARKAFSSPDFMLCLTPQSLVNFRKVMQRTSFKDGVLFIARRENAILKPAASAFISFMKSIGAEVPVLHTSDHADSDTIDRLIRDVRPSILVPVRTNPSEWFARYEDECLVVYDCRDYEI